MIGTSDKRGNAQENTLPMTHMTNGSGFFIGFERDGAQAETQGNRENDGEKLDPHGVASSLALTARGKSAD